MKVKKETNTRKLTFRTKAREEASKIPIDKIDFEASWNLYKLDYCTCTLHDQANPRSVNCRDNPYCINRLGLEKFQKLLKNEQLRADKVTKDQKRRDVDELPCGLVNSGNFCYVNSFLQVWFNEPVFRQIIYDWRSSPEYQRPDPPFMDVEAVMDSLQHLFYTLEMSPFEDTSENSSFIDVLRLGNEQQDAQEFTIMLFDALDRNLSKHPNGEKTRNAIKQRCIGSLNQRLWCKCGQKNNVTEQTFTSLQVIIEGHKTVDDALKALFEEEVLDDYRCDCCGERGSVRRQTSPEKLPNVLLLQLNRYRYDGSGRHKVKTPLAYGRELAASSICSKLKKGEDYDYELFAVMIHEGDNTYCGHYYDLVKHPVNGKWYRYDDEKVELIKAPGCDRNNVKAPQRPPVDMKACYGLVYRRKSDAVPFNYPPAEKTNAWITKMEEKFYGQTDDEMKRSQLRVAEVNKRYDALFALFESLKTDADKAKKHRDVAFLPTNLLSDVLGKEFARAESIAENVGTSNANGTATQDLSLSTSFDVGAEQSDTETGKGGRKRRGRPAAHHIPRLHISQLLDRHEMPLCCHGKVSLDSVLFGDVKAVSCTAAEILLTRYAISIEVHREEGRSGQRGQLQTGSDICVECCKQLHREHHFTAQLEADCKMATKLANTKQRCSLEKWEKPDDYFYVSKPALHSLKKLALREKENVDRCQLAASSMLVFTANATNGVVPLVTPCEPKKEDVTGDEPKGRGRRRKRPLPERTTVSPEESPVKQRAPERRDPKFEEDVGVLSAVEEMVANVSREEESAEKESGTRDAECNGLGAETQTKIVLENGINGTSEKQKEGSEESGERRSVSCTSQAEVASTSGGASDSDANEEIVFNSDLKCRHGNVNWVTGRVALSPEEWDRVKAYFRNYFELRCDGDLCEECADEKQQEDSNRLDQNSVTRDMISKFVALMKNIQARRPTEGEYGSVYTRGICSDFCRTIINLQKRNRDAKMPKAPSICQKCVICDHGKPFKPLVSDDFNTQEMGACILPITEEEWSRITEYWATIHPDSYPEPIVILPGGTVDDMCERCFGENVEAITMQKYIYESATIFVKLQVDLEDSSEASGVKSTRRTKQKNLFKVKKMSSMDTVRDLKVKLYNECRQSPIDQLLYNGAELLEDDSTLQGARIEADPDRPLILIAQTIPNSPTRDEPRAPERGFIDTALAH